MIKKVQLLLSAVMVVASAAGPMMGRVCGQDSILDTGPSKALPPPVVNPSSPQDDVSPSDLVVPKPLNTSLTDQPQNAAAGNTDREDSAAGNTDREDSAVKDPSTDTSEAAGTQASNVPAKRSATSSINGSNEIAIRSVRVSSVASTARVASSAVSIVEPAVQADADESSEPAVVFSSDPASLRLQQIVLRAKDALDAEQLPTWEKAEAKLQSALQRVDNFLALAPSQVQGWSDFLMLDDIREELKEDRPDYRQFALFEMNMRQNYVGLERQAMLQLREALDYARRAALYGTNPENTIRVLERRIEQLVETLAEPASGADTERTTDVARLANYFYETEQVPWAISEMRSSFSVPNVQVFARESVINRLIGRAVAEPSPVNECILGTRILGRACLQGSVYADILPMHGGVAVNLNLTGQLSSNNRGFNRGVVLRTTGTSPVYASKKIYATLDSISSAPATVATNLTTSINSIEHRLRIVRRIAKRKAAEQKPQADRISEGRLQTKLRSQYDEQVEQQLAEARVRLQETRAKSQSRPEFQRLNVPRPALAVYSTDSTVNANVVQAASFQLAAEKSCSIARPGHSDAVLELHQSALNNVLHNLFAGRTIRDTDLDDFAIQFLGRVPEELKNQTTIDKFEATLPSFNPISLELDDNQVKLTLRFTELKGADRTVRGATVSVVYDIHYRDGVFTLVRQGDIDVDVSAGSNIARTSLRSAVRKKMEPLFKDVIVTDRIDLTRSLPNAPHVDLNWIKIHDGWAQVGVR